MFSGTKGYICPKKVIWVCGACVERCIQHVAKLESYSCVLHHCPMIFMLPNGFPWISRAISNNHQKSLCDFWCVCVLYTFFRLSFTVWLDWGWFQLSPHHEYLQTPNAAMYWTHLVNTLKPYTSHICNLQQINIKCIVTFGPYLVYSTWGLM